MIEMPNSMVMSPERTLKFETIPFSEWRAGISPLWHLQGKEQVIRRVLNGHGQMRYMGSELARRVILFPIVALFDGARVGWTSAYNISDEAVRIRGIYVLPEYRAYGIGRGLIEHVSALWPASFTKVFMYARVSNVERYERWGFTQCEEFEPRRFEMRHLVDDKEVVLMSKQRAAA